MTSDVQIIFTQTEDETFS